jgi:hypothetical protein
VRRVREREPHAGTIARRQREALHRDLNEINPGGRIYVLERHVRPHHNA